MSEKDLASRYDLIIFDLDGVLYVGDQPVVRASEAMRRLRHCDARVMFATNNASRSGHAVACLLESVGISARAEEVLTSARASAMLLAQQYPMGSSLLVVGSPALADEVRQVGFCPVLSADDDPVAVIQGFSPTLSWEILAEASVAIRRGSRWVATNADRTLPSPRGLLPGNGALIAALTTTLDRQPDIIVGKPNPALFYQATEMSAASRPLIVGDRLDTDIEGAHQAGMDSLLVLTGVSCPSDVLFARHNRRPTYVAEDLDELFTNAEPIAASAVGGWKTHGEEGLIILDGEGSPVDALKALCGYWWSVSDGGSAIPVVRGASTFGKSVLSKLGLT